MSKTKRPKPRLVIECTKEYRKKVVKAAGESGFDSYSSYVKHCIDKQQNTMQEI